MPRTAAADQIHSWSRQYLICPSEARCLAILQCHYPWIVALGMKFHRCLALNRRNKFIGKQIASLRLTESLPNEEEHDSASSSLSSWRRRCWKQHHVLARSRGGQGGSAGMRLLFALGDVRGSTALCVVDPSPISVVISVSDLVPQPTPGGEDGPMSTTLLGDFTTQCVLAPLMEGGQVDVLRLLWIHVVVPWLSCTHERAGVVERVTTTWALESAKWGLLPITSLLCPAWVQPYEPAVFPILLGCMRKTSDEDSRCGCDAGRRAVMEYLLSQEGTTIDSCDEVGATLLIEACRNDCLDCVRFLTEKKNAKVNLADHNDIAPLSWAASSGSVACIELLVALGSELESRTRDAEQTTAVHFAAYENQIDALRALDKAGADVWATTGQNKTAAGIARLLGYDEMYSVLTLEMAKGIRNKSMI